LLLQLDKENNWKLGFCYFEIIIKGYWQKGVMNMSKSKNARTCCGATHQGNTNSKVYRNKRFYFCKKTCLEEFLIDPEAFIASDHFLIDFNDLEDA
jgi:YHS domain-containing protein